MLNHQSVLELDRKRSNVLNLRSSRISPIMGAHRLHGFAQKFHRKATTDWIC